MVYLHLYTVERSAHCQFLFCSGMGFFTAYEVDVLRESGMVFGRVMYKASTSRVTICPLIP